MSSSDESGIDQPIPSSSTLPDRERHTERVLGKRGLEEFLVVDHTANPRKNATISLIWHHGGERRRVDDDSMARYWRYSYCTGRATVLKVDRNGRQTTYALNQKDPSIITSTTIVTSPVVHTHSTIEQQLEISTRQIFQIPTVFRNGE
jgi:hypothetical protein